MWIRYEDPEIYDGWIVEFNENFEFRWREHYIVNSLSKQQKDIIEERIKSIKQ